MVSCYLRAVPRDVVGNETSVTPFLQKLSYTFEIAFKFSLGIAFRPTNVIAVGPEFILHTLIRMRKRLPPVKVDVHHFITCKDFLQIVTKGFINQSRWDCDVLCKIGVLSLIRSVHSDEGLNLVVSHKHCCCPRILCIPGFECKIASWKQHDQAGTWDSEFKEEVDLSGLTANS